jgi:hypothetical protein
MARIVRTAYRYQRPPRKRLAAALDVPAVVKAADPAKARKRAKAALPESTPVAPAAISTSRAGASAAPAANDDRKPAIVTISSRKHAMLAHLLEDMTSEEHRRRGDAADALFRKGTGKDTPGGA